MPNIFSHRPPTCPDTLYVEFRMLNTVDPCYKTKAGKVNFPYSSKLFNIWTKNNLIQTWRIDWLLIQNVQLLATITLVFAYILEIHFRLRTVRIPYTYSFGWSASLMARAKVESACTSLICICFAATVAPLIKHVFPFRNQILFTRTVFWKINDYFRFFGKNSDKLLNPPLTIHC